MEPPKKTTDAQKGTWGETVETLKLERKGGAMAQESVQKSQQMAANVRPPQPAVAAGFAEATSAYLAQGGGIRIDKKGRKFMSGALKGMTQDQAVERAKVMWDKASPAIKEKYAARARDRATNGEKAAAGQMAAFGGGGERRDSGAPVRMQGNRSFAEGNSTLEQQEEEEDI